MSIYYRTDSYVIKANVDNDGGVMVALRLPPEAAKALAVEDGQLPESLHLTLAYLGKAADLSSERLQLLHDIVAAIAATESPVTGHVQGYGVFSETKDGPCLYASYDSPSLARLRLTLADALNGAGLPIDLDKGFVPHITLAYGESAPPKPLPSIPITFTGINVTLGGTEAWFKFGDVAKWAGAIGATPELDRDEDSPKTPWEGKTDALGTIGNEVLDGRGKTVRRVVDGVEHYSKDGVADPVRPAGQITTEPLPGGDVDAYTEQQRHNMNKEGDGGGAMTTGDLNSGGRIAPAQGRFLTPEHPRRRAEKYDNLNTDTHTGGSALDSYARDFRLAPGKTRRINPYESLLKAQKAVAIDFDGTITLDEKGTENPRMRALVDELLDADVRVVIFTARPAHDVHVWLRTHDWPSLEVTNVKSHEFGVYLDDRAVNFAPGMAGAGLADKLAGFKTWWEKSAHDAGVQPESEPGDRKKPMFPAVAIVGSVEKEWNEADHPRTAAGTAEGGQFAGAGGGVGKPGEHAADWEKPGALPTEMKPAQVGTAEEQAQRANRWFEAHPNQVPRAPGGEAATDRTDEAAAWRVGQGDSPTEQQARAARMWNEAHPNEPPREVPVHEPTPTAGEDAGKESSGEKPTSELPSSLQDEPTPEPATAESWDELDGDQQDRAKNRWFEASHDDFAQAALDNWRENEDNFAEVPKEVSEDGEWTEQAVKDAAVDVYPGERVPGTGEGVGPETAAAHDEEQRRINEWAKNFDVDASYKASAFEVDDEGHLVAYPERMVFHDNPYADESQQMLPGIDREEMSNNWKKNQWERVRADFEEQIKTAFDKEVEERVDKLKENPPSSVLEGVEEYQAEHWDQMSDNDKFNVADKYLTDLKGGGGGGGEGDGGMGRGAANVEGEVEPDEHDSPEQKKITSKFTDKTVPSTERKKLGGGVSVTMQVTVGKSKYVWKPSTGEPSGFPVDAGTAYQREVAAYDIGKLVGMKNMMPVASIVKYPDHKGKMVWGVMMEKIPDAHNDGERGDKDFKAAATRGAYFDWIIGNMDRHDNNYMSDDKGKLWLVDHGLSMSDDSHSGAHRDTLWSLAGIDRDAEVPETIKKPWAGKWPKIKSILQRRGLSDHAIENVESRYLAAQVKDAKWGDLR